MQVEWTGLRHLFNAVTCSRLGLACGRAACTAASAAAADSPRRWTRKQLKDPGNSIRPLRMAQTLLLKKSIACGEFEGVCVCLRGRHDASALAGLAV